MATSPNFSWPEPDNTDLVKNGALAIRTAVDAIDASMVDLKGGTTGQVLSKTSNTDMDFTWVAQDDSNAIQNAIVDAKGDIIVATAADTPSRLAVGANNTVLTADSSTATGLKWATPAAGGGGKVLQVVSATTTTTTTITSTSLTDSGITATITPTSATSKILVIISAATSVSKAAVEGYGGAKLLRGGTTIADFGTGDFQGVTADGTIAFTRVKTSPAITYYDSPATTSATTYKVQGRGLNASTTIEFQSGNAPSTITLLEIGA